MKRRIMALLLALIMLMLFMPLFAVAGEIESENDLKDKGIKEIKIEKEEEPGEEPRGEAEKEPEEEPKKDSDTESGEEPDTTINKETEDDEADGEEESPEASICAPKEPLDDDVEILEALSSDDTIDLECTHGSYCNNPFMIGTTCYSTLESAIAVVQNGQAIEMRSDVLIAANVSVSRQVAFTIETKGHQLVINAPGNNPPSGVLTISRGVDLTINGNISSRIIVNGDGKLTITGNVTTRSGSGNDNAVQISGPGSQITIGGSLLVTSTTNGEKIGINAEDGANVIVNGSIIINATQDNSVGIRALNSIVTVGGDIKGVTRGVVADLIPGHYDLATDVTINGTIESTRFDVVWVFQHAPAVGVDEGNGYLTYRAITHGKELIVRVGYASKCVDFCAGCSECLTCSECKCQADYSAVNTAIEAANEVDRSLYTEESLAVLDAALSAVVHDLNIAEQDKVDSFAEAIYNAIAGLVLIPDTTPPTTPKIPRTRTTPVVETIVSEAEEPIVPVIPADAGVVEEIEEIDADDEVDEEGTIIPDNQAPGAAEPVGNSGTGNATPPTTNEGTEDTQVEIEDDEVPLAPSIFEDSQRSFGIMMFTALGIAVVLPICSILSMKIRKLEKSYKGTDT